MSKPSKANAGVRLFSLAVEIAPATYVVATGQAPMWIRIWIGTWLAVWLIATVAQSSA